MSRYDLEDSDIESLLGNAPKYRISQIKKGLYEDLNDPEDISVLPKSLRRYLQEHPQFSSALRPVLEQTADKGLTRKWLYALHDGSSIETVLMHYSRYSTVCVSSQSGCAMACTFCATGHAGYTRQLSSGEILEQIVRAARASRRDNRRLDHVVYMGMGEPFANFSNVWRSVERITGEMGIGARRVTLSTVGLIPQIRLLASKPLQVNLAISLHAANNTLRSTLVPINRRYPIEALLATLEEYKSKTHRRVTFEWALIHGVNDRDSDVTELANIAKRLQAHVNIIPMNSTYAGSLRGYKGSPASRVTAFRDALRSLDVIVTVRKTRGGDIDAACGQLAGSISTSHTQPQTPRPHTEALPTRQGIRVALSSTRPIDSSQTSEIH